MTLALIADDTERKLLVVTALYPAEEPWMEGHDVRDVSKVAGIEPGWLVAEDGSYSAPVTPPPPVPDVISDRQFFQQIAVDGDITQDEALAAVQTGKLPAKLDAAIASLPEQQQFPARMLVCGATEFRRSNPMVPVLGEAIGRDSAALDALWTSAAEL